MIILEKTNHWPPVPTAFLRGQRDFYTKPRPRDSLAKHGGTSELRLVVGPDQWNEALAKSTPKPSFKTISEMSPTQWPTISAKLQFSLTSSKGILPGSRWSGHSSRRPCHPGLYTCSEPIRRNRRKKCAIRCKMPCLTLSDSYWANPPSLQISFILRDCQ